MLNSKIILPEGHESHVWQSEHFGFPLFSALQQKSNSFFLCLAPNVSLLHEWQSQLHFFIKNTPQQKNIFLLPDLETLPYDQFSPHRDILSDRLSILSQLPDFKEGILFCTLAGALQRLPPISFIRDHSLILKVGATLSPMTLRERLLASGYHLVQEVREHGELAVRGAIIDLFPMGFNHPIRIDWLDDEIDSMRLFSKDTQKSIKSITELNLLPAREFPFDSDAIRTFSSTWKNTFHGNPLHCPLYQDVNQGILAQGLEYYFPLFFDGKSATLFDYLPKNTTLIYPLQFSHFIQDYWREIQFRYEQNQHDLTRPLLTPEHLFLTESDFNELAAPFPKLILTQAQDAHSEKTAPAINIQFPIEKEHACLLSGSSQSPWEQLKHWAHTHPEQRILFCAESKGRREILLTQLAGLSIHPSLFETWTDFQKEHDRFGCIIDELSEGFYFEKKIAVITENVLSNRKISTYKSKRRSRFNPDQFIKDLSELRIGDPVVHIDHGIGRYRGLTVLCLDEIKTECVCIEYAENDKLYIPISALNRLSRYTSGETQHAPLHKLGSSHFQKAKERLLKKVEDVASELLHIHALRAASTGFSMEIPEKEYEKFIASFPFNTTPDQERAIENTLNDLQKNIPMDRVICGDVGFGKTEVAMRAAFIASMNHKQVAILVPTTLLAEQHFQNFKNRFADFPIQIELLSRFKTKKELALTLQSMKEGKTDIVVGTHKLLQADIQFKDMGLIIIDEEHRFGVKAKEKLKQWRSNAHILTLTATPIPRTLHFSMAGLRDLSIIATPPDRRLSVKTFLHEESKDIIIEAISRELLRGGQVYFLHNDVSNIERTAEKIQGWISEARVGVAHGQLREHALEKVMLDFYHRRCNVLVCSTIIESGIDVPSANTIIIERADKLGLAQLHQLRGRVGRSHHQAYAYLLSPPLSTLQSDAQKRLIAISEATDLGTGFTLATHDLEIRGAGELLGEEQSGHFHEVGYALYMEFLNNAIAQLKSGNANDAIQHQTLLTSPCEINCHLTALIPDTYLNDPSLRLAFYKRISACQTQTELDELQIEMIDRFGLFPKELKQLFEEATLARMAHSIGIKKIDANAHSVRIEFKDQTTIQPQTIIRLIQKSGSPYRLDGPNRLRYTLEPHEPEKRIIYLHQILKTLTQENG